MSISDSSSRLRNDAFIEAAMAASALVATAGGALGFAERHKLDEILESLTPFTAFNYRTALVRFEALAEDIRRRPEEGRSRALKAVSAIADNAQDSRVILRIACAVARDEGYYAPDRIARISDIARTLGQAPPALSNHAEATRRSRSRRAFCITIGNQKGGTGKSTTAVHLAIGLLARGQSVGCIDLDGEQGTFSHYLANRRAYAEKAGAQVPMPVCRRLQPSEAQDQDLAEQEDRARLNEAVEAFAGCDYLIVDTPGNQGRLSRLGHVNADVLITPLNDSFLDIDVLAEIDLDARQGLAPSAYAQMVMTQNEQRRARGWPPIDWVVMRNRLGQLDTRNSRDMRRLLDQLSQRMGFRLLPGLSERMVFRELFYKGLTLFDLPEATDAARDNASRWNARNEIGRLVDAMAACREAEQASEMESFSADLNARISVPPEGPEDAPADGEADPEDAFRMLQEAMGSARERP
jgi:chromosome partitioning protein